MKVSIYTPTKNRQEALAKAIDSVLNQTYRDIELIVVSDGSTDDTESYLKARALQDPRLKFFIKENSEGAPAARNLAIKNATGDFITGLDDDDLFLPNRIEMFVDYWQLLAKHGLNPSFIYGQDLIYSNGKEVGRTQKVGQATTELLFEFNHVGNQIFAPKSHYIDAGLFDEAMPAWQDMEFFYRVLAMYGPASLLDYPTQIVDDSPRSDRIKTKAGLRLRAANARFIKKHATNSNRNSQKLFLQMFSRYYGLKPGMSDWIWFMKLGFWPNGIMKLATCTLRR